MARTDLEPPPSQIPLVSNNTGADATWKTWLNKLHERLKKIMKTGYTSSDNSSSTAIDNGDNFAGAWENVSGYNSLVTAVATDQDGYYEIQFSPDGVNVDSTLTRYYRVSQIEPPHRFTITRDYFKIIFYNNSGTNQTYFRLQTQIGEKNDLNIPLDSTMSQDYDSTSVRPSNFNYEVGLGRRQGYTTWNKWGYNPDIDAAASETIWSVGGVFAEMTTATTLDITSTDANDTSAGTGAQSIVIYGVDANYNEQIEVVTMNGATIVTTTGSWLGVNRMSIYLAGSGGINAGDIDAVVTAGGSTQAQIPAGEGSTQHAFFFVPASHTFLLDWLFLNVVKTSGGGNPEIVIKAWVTSLVSGSKYEVFRDTVDTQRENHIELKPSQPFVVGEKSLLTFEGTTDTNNTAVSARFSGITVRDVDA